MLGQAKDILTRLQKDKSDWKLGSKVSYLLSQIENLTAKKPQEKTENKSQK